MRAALSTAFDRLRCLIAGVFPHDSPNPPTAAPSTIHRGRAERSCVPIARVADHRAALDGLALALRREAPSWPISLSPSRESLGARGPDFRTTVPTLLPRTHPMRSACVECLRLSPMPSSSSVVAALHALSDPSTGAATRRSGIGGALLGSAFHCTCGGWRAPFARSCGTICSALPDDAVVVTPNAECTQHESGHTAHAHVAAVRSMGLGRVELPTHAYRLRSNHLATGPLSC